MDKGVIGIKLTSNLLNRENRLIGSILTGGAAILGPTFFT